MNHPVPKAPLALTLAFGVCLLTPVTNADEPKQDATKPAKTPGLSKALAENAPAILKYLRGKGYKNVGVLDFEFQRGDRKITLADARMSARMARRVEVALLLTMKDQQVRLMEDASETVRQTRLSPKPTPLDEKGRKAFFRMKGEFTPAWGDLSEVKGVKPDAFLTGTAKLDGKTGLMEVAVRAFDRRGKLEDVRSFVAATADDPDVKLEAGLSFVRSRGLGKKGEEKKDTVKADLDPDTPAVVSGMAAWKDAPVELEISYDGEPIELQETKDDDYEHAFVPPPKPGQKVSIRLRHRGDDDTTYGVALRINGENSIDPDTTVQTALDSRKWVMRKGSSVTLQGYQIDDKQSRAFEVRLADDAGKQANPDKVGTIELVIFRDKNANTPRRTNEEPKEQDLVKQSTKKEEELVIDRGVVSSQGAIPRELKIVQTKLLQKRKKSAGGGDDDDAMFRGREVIITKGGTEKREVRVVPFEVNPNPIVGLTIRYVKAK